jgi:hypothetical protein
MLVPAVCMAVECFKMFVCLAKLEFFVVQMRSFALLLKACGHLVG